MLNKTDDRVLLASLIIQECISNSTLTEQARVDGLRIAGHACFSENSMDNALDAFEALGTVASSPRWLCESHRMQAQIHESRGEIELALTHYNAARIQAEIDDPNGVYATTQSILNRLCILYERNGDFDELLNIALSSITLYPAENQTKEQAIFLYWAYKANKLLGINSLALDHLTTLLERRPDFGNDQPFLGVPPLLRLEVHELQGRGWSKPSEDFINDTIDVLYNPDYFYMPSRLDIAKQFGAMLEDFGKYDSAIHIRSNLRTELVNAIENNSDIDTFLKNSLHHRATELGLDDAKLQLKTGDPVSAVSTLAEITNSQFVLPQDTLDQIAALSDTAQDLLPAP